MTIDPSYDEISERARSLWQSRGQPQGQDNEIWLDAERELRARSGSSTSMPQSDNGRLSDAALAGGKNQRKRSAGRSDSKSQAGAT